MTTFYISPTGNDSTGAGTLVSPWATLGKAYASSSSGDTVMVAAGTYTWVAIAPGNNITIIWTVIGANAATTIFDGAAATFFQNLVANTSWSNLTFQNASVSFADSASGVGSTQNFTNCNFYNVNSANFNDGIFKFGNGSTLNLTGCVFTNPGYILSDFSAPTSAFNILNNTVYFTPSSTPFGFTRTATGTPQNISLINNIFFNNSGTPVQWFGFNQTGVVYTGSNNDIMGYTSAPSLPNQISADPLFVNAASNNFNLRPTSPCIGTGTVI